MVCPLPNKGTTIAMKIKAKIKWFTNLLMTILLLCLMAYQVTGDMLHEWIGTTTLIVFTLHNVLNIRWYSSLFKGKYTAPRIFRTIVNLGILASILCLGFSGIVMSRYVFAALPINGPMATARTMHLASSYWGFVLMCVHLGVHWSMVVGAIKSTMKRKGIPSFVQWCSRLVGLFIAGYGLYCFHKANIISYMFLRNQFVFFDFELPAYLVFIEYAAMMVFFVFAAYSIAKIIRWLGKKTKRKENSHEKS